VSEPDPNYPLSVFTSAFSSVVVRSAIFVLTCIAAIAVGNWIRVGWQNPFNSGVIALTIIASIISIWGAVFYAALLMFFVLFLRYEGSWIWLPVAFITQAIDAWLMADAFK
jgi:hypothetical protein